jgi:hypothetical protein
MLCYNSDQRPVVKALQGENWDNEEIQKYLDYLNRKRTLINTGRKHGKYSRDSDRSKVYNAEFKYESRYGMGLQFANIAMAQKYCDKILASATWKKMSKGRVSENLAITLGTMRGSRIAGRAWGPRYWGHHIELNTTRGLDDLPIGLNQYVLFHELAHCVGNMHHDTEFRIDLLKLVSRFIGKEQATYLKKCFKEKKLKLSINKKVMAPEQWRKMSQRISKARSAMK